MNSKVNITATHKQFATPVPTIFSISQTPFLSVVSLTLWQSHGCPSVNEAEYRQVSNIRRTLAGYKIADHPDVVGASPVGAAPTTSSFST